jgi:hypothetical protein
MKMRIVVALAAFALVAVACSSDQPAASAGDDGSLVASGQLPDGWKQVEADGLRYGVPSDFEASDPPIDPQYVVSHHRGDPSDGSALEMLGVYRSSATTSEGSDLPLQAYAAELFGLGGLAGGVEDLTIETRQDLDVDGAIEAEVLRVTFDGGELGGTVEQTVVLVRTVEWIYDLRYLGLASVTDDSIAGTLPDTVSLT